MKHILSYGGGVNSSALFFYLIKNNKPLDLVIFADTGEETFDTYDAVDRMISECIFYNISFKIVKSTYGNLYDYYFEHRAVPSLMRRDCTMKFKISPIRQYIRAEYGLSEKFIMYLGIAWDEALRIRDSPVKYIAHSYPFVDARVTRGGNQDILKQHNFSAVKSGCIGCPYQKKKSWINMLIENPVEFKRHKDLEQNCSRYPEITLNGSYKLSDLENSWRNQTSLNNFTDIEETCNSINGGCFL